MIERLETIKQAWESLAVVHQKAGCPDDLLAEFKRFFYSGANVTLHLIAYAQAQDRANESVVRRTNNPFLDTKIADLWKELEQYLLDWSAQMAEEVANAQDNEPQPPLAS